MPSAAPHLPGYADGTWLGGGGFADVFRYEQERPRKDVAVKVLRTVGLDDSALDRFESEANIMAAVSEHPFIVNITTVGTTPDGRPFLVMDYYPERTYADRVLAGPLPPADVLRLGIQMASALESAHRQNIIHRDVKPANILVDRFGRPGLTDFGIAGSSDASHADAGDGVSVPWAPPEVLATSAVGDVRGDVYSLAATLYHLLAGHQPFAVAGADNSQNAQIVRILHQPPAPLAGVPTALDAVLRAAMAKDPAARPASMVELGRSLQAVETQLHLPPTEFIVQTPTTGPRPLLPEGLDAEATRAQVPRVSTVAVEGPPEDTRARPAKPVPTAAGYVDHAAERKPPAPEETRLRLGGGVATAAVRQENDVPAASRKRLWASVGAVVVLAALVVGTVLLSSSGKDPGPSPTVVPTDVVPTDVAVPAPPVVTGLTAARGAGDMVLLSWTAPGAVDGDTYRIRHRADPHEGDPAVTSRKTSVTVTAAAGEQACWTVTTVRSGRTSEESVLACVTS